ncbi:DUF2158 domain-containing protein [Ideonella azotifigens]|uniref:DUF2158 domain-containing protein n=1 Tax=Ideonella azotifigens TaxID=513160 RepID=A0ABN1K846_9BURK|nr:DUF2158 domain-containing protein [Ideonella azotifigens]MCD2342936.1 DUF2158 domain-containing protein [Ideonella azotifigens]
MAETFKPGDVVRLKAGGPKMVVEYVQDDRKLACVWFLEGNTKRDLFPGECVETPPAKEA